MIFCYEVTNYIIGINKFIPKTNCKMLVIRLVIKIKINQNIYLNGKYKQSDSSNYDNNNLCCHLNRNKSM